MQGESQTQIRLEDLEITTDSGQTHLKRRERFLPPDLPREVNFEWPSGQTGVSSESNKALEVLSILRKSEQFFKDDKPKKTVEMINAGAPHTFIERKLKFVRDKIVKVDVFV